MFLATEQDRATMTQVLKEFAYTLCQAGKERGWELDALRDLARVLRPPGTINRKYDKSVQVLQASDVRYALADFDWLTPLPAPSVHHGAGAGMQDQPDLAAVVEAYGGTLTQKSDQECHGSHPQHGSSTGVNFDVNTTKHLWHCWRHGTGGDALSLIAVCEGLLGCDTLQPGALGGALFRKVLDIAKTRFGWTPPERPRRAMPPMTHPPAPEADDPEAHLGALAHRLPDHLRDNPDPRVRRHWRQVYRTVNELKQRYSRDPYALVVPSHAEGASHGH